MQREEPYQGLTCAGCPSETGGPPFVGVGSQVVHGCRQLVS